MKSFFKQRRMRKVVDQHVTKHGGFCFDGRTVATPHDLRLSIQYQIAEGSYERSEAALIERFLPRDLPVVELGGCLGLVSSFVAARLAPDKELVVVEANPTLIECCRHNASLAGTRDHSRVIHGAIAYDSDIVHFGISDNVHINRVGASDGVTVPATTLAKVLSTVSTPDGFTLICDIEGAEIDLIEHEATALANCKVAIIELHPHVYADRGTSSASVLSSLAKLGLRVAANDDNVYALTR